MLQQKPINMLLHLISYYASIKMENSHFTIDYSIILFVYSPWTRSALELFGFLDSSTDVPCGLSPSTLSSLLFQ